jgi:hypothetical protein
MRSRIENHLDSLAITAGVPLAQPVQTKELLLTKSRLPNAISVTQEPPKLYGLSDDQVG